MVGRRTVLLALTAAGLAGCAAFNPYIRDGAKLSGEGVGLCAQDWGAAKELTYACSTLIKLERARSQIVGTRSTLTATLFPIAGLIGYNSFRGINTSNNAALVSGGLAGYSAVTTLAQADRIAIYDQGLTSVSCAIGRYHVARTVTPAETLERQTLAVKAAKIRENISSYLNESLRNGDGEEDQYAHELEGYLDTVDATEEWLRNTAATRGLVATINQFVLNTVASVNRELTLTVPNNSEIAGDVLETFQLGGGTKDSVGALLPRPPPPPASSGRAPAMADSTPAEVAEIRRAMTELLALYTEVSAKPVAAAPLDLSPCSYQSVAGVGFKASNERLILGAANSANGSTVTLARGGQTQLLVSGGTPPYTPTVTGPGTIDAKITGENGVSRLEVHVPANATEGRYFVRVADATGNAERGLTVVVAQ